MLAPDHPIALRLIAAVRAGSVDARFIGVHRETPLHWAASSDDVEAIRIDKVLHDGLSARRIAARHDDPELTAWLARH